MRTVDVEVEWVAEGFTTTHHTLTVPDGLDPSEEKAWVEQEVHMLPKVLPHEIAVTETRPYSWHAEEPG